MTLTDEQRQQLRARVIAFERATGTELVTAVLPRCDDYPEIPWKAFASGVAAGTLLVLAALVLPGLDLLAGLGGGWGRGGCVVPLIVVMGAGLLSAAMALLLAPYARVFLAAARAEGEARQAAQVLFLEQELFRTRDRTGLLLMVAGFERRVILLADSGLRARVPAQVLDDVVATVTSGLGRGGLGASLMAGIDRLEALLRAHGLAVGPDGNVLPDAVQDVDREGA